MHLYAQDNHLEKITSDEKAITDLRRIADIHLTDLKDQAGHNLWLFPPKGDRYDDKIQDETILSFEGDKVRTGNILGFVGIGDTELTIRSRFSNDDDNDWFMQYMLQKVFAINIFDLKHARSNEDSLDIAALMLPYFLQKALHQGLYREYVRKNYNDSRVHGTINVSRHIAENFPFKNGKIAYTTKEFTYDNSITQLVRHTIEYIRTKKVSAAEILYSSAETQANIKQIIDATPSFRKGDKSKIMLANLKPKIHPYYSEYRPLQRLCMQILRNEKISYGAGLEHIHGVLFDGAWLWEEYLNIVFKQAGFEHPENKTGRGRIYPFKDKNRYSRYPDFKKDGIIADAKYKFLLDESDGLADDRITRDDLNQMIAYMHITSSADGIFVNPLNFRVLNPETGEYYPETAFCTTVGELYGGGGKIHVIGVNIPKKCESYKEFSEHMARNEKVLLNKLLQF